MVRLEIYFENMGTDLLNGVGVVNPNNGAFQGREDVKKGAGEIKISTMLLWTHRLDARNRISCCYILRSGNIDLRQ